MDINSSSSKADRMEALITSEPVGQIAERVITKIREEGGESPINHPRRRPAGSSQKQDMTKPESGDDLETAMKNLSKPRGILATSSSPAAEPGKRGRGRPRTMPAPKPKKPII